jgi:hypothetical protein
MAGKTALHTKYKNKDGIVVPSVTTIIGGQLAWNKNVLIAWAKRTAASGEDPDKVRDKSADIGTIAHYLIECKLLGTEPELGDYATNDIEMAKNAFNAFSKWWEAKDFAFLQSELPVVSEQYQFGGTIDLLAKHGDDVILIDFKTSNGVYKEHLVQVAAYTEAYVETFGDLKDVYILQLSKDSDSFSEHYVSKEKINLCWEAFMYARYLHDIEGKITV